MAKEIFKDTYLVEKDIFAMKSYFKDSIYTSVFIIKKDKDVLLIDTGVLSSFPKIKKVLEHVGYKNIFIINTHSHWDHIGSNYDLKKEYNCLIMGHLNGAENFKDLPLQWEKVFNKRGSIIKLTEEDRILFLKETNKGVLPDILVGSDEIINIDDNNYKIIYTPGHSNCSICIYDLTSKYLFSGDLLSGNGVSDGVVIIDDDYERYINSINLIKKLEIKKIFTSHFDVKQGKEVNNFINISLAELLEYKRIVISIIENIKKITLMDLINEFVGVTGKRRNLYWVENSIKKVILSLIKNDIVRKEGEFYLLK